MGTTLHVRSTRLLLATATLVACRAESSTPPEDAVATAPALSPEPEPASEAAADPTAAALARLPTVVEGVAAVRKLAFKTEIGAQRQSTADFEVFVTAELDRELPVEKSAALSRALHHVGLLTDPIDLRSTLTTALVSQVGAYYDPAQSKFFVVMASGQPLMADVINAHELTHGLQDQHFDLQRYLGEGEGTAKLDLNSDEVTARRFVVEGEATLVMSAYPVYAMGNGALMLEDPSLAGVLEQQVSQTEGASVEELLALNVEQSKMQMEMLGDDFAEAAHALGDIPPYISVPLMLPYLRGMTAVYRVYRAGGWDAVSKLYAEPPSSSEQVLHPVEKLIESRDEPVKLRIDTESSALRGWTVVDDDTLGELLWQVYFGLWGVPAAAPAAGWGGDHIVYLSRGDEQLGLLATTWDTVEDAREFHEAYAKSLSARFADGKPRTKGTTTTHPRGADRWVTVVRKGKDVAIVDGADAKAGPALAKLALAATRG
jgi:hypothetical protein